jgi:hypothetical protein
MPFNGVAGKALNGWWFSGILSVQNGTPFDVGISGNRSRSQSQSQQRGDQNLADRMNVFAGRTNQNIILGGPERYFDPSAFYLQPEGPLGNAGRNILVGPGLANLDFSLAKDTSLGFLGESGRLEFRADFFNILNRVNFDHPDEIVFSGTGATAANVLPTAGQITETATKSREVQLSLKIVF